MSPGLRPVNVQAYIQQYNQQFTHTWHFDAEEIEFTAEATTTSTSPTTTTTMIDDDDDDDDDGMVISGKKTGS